MRSGGDVKLTLESALLDDKCFIGRPEFDRFDYVIFSAALALGSFVLAEVWSCISGAPHSEHSFYLLCGCIGLIWYQLARVVIGGGSLFNWNGHTKLALISGTVFFAASFALLSVPYSLLDLDIETSNVSYTTPLPPPPPPPLPPSLFRLLITVCVVWVWV